MIVHRDSPGLEPEDPDLPPVRTSRRFARLVESSASRRLSRPRLTLAIVAATGVTALAFAGWFTIQWVTIWVATQPEHQLSFAQIELVPEPGPWIRGGSSVILDEVRRRAKYPEKISVVGLNLQELETDFRLNPWVKGIVKVRRSYGRLQVSAVYRKPVAFLVPRTKGLKSIAIDEEGVPLPVGEIDWTADKPLSVKGISTPLIEICPVNISVPPRFGVPCKRTSANGTTEEEDPLILQAARLAEFLRQEPLTPLKNRAPHFVAIHLPDEPMGPFFLYDSGMHWVKWGKAPGDEKPGELSSEAQWKLLMDYLDQNGPLTAKDPSYYHFTRKGVELAKGTPRN